MAVRRLAIAALVCFASVLGASAKVLFFEPFDEPFGTKWSQSEDPSYEGKWKYQKSEGSEDFGLFIPDKAKKYGIATVLQEAVDFTRGPVVLQYDVRLQKGFDCGGAYIKFLMPQPEGFRAGDFKDTTPYSIMFGPDKCGATNKVHFIFRQKSPKTGEYVEHHLEKSPTPKSEWVAHVYTAIVDRANNSVKVLIDDEEAAFGDLLSYKDFKPPVLLPKTIKDPEDKKPEDWDERPKIADPEAKKPDDWDEDAPREIPDEDANKPEGWLDDEPLEVDDPEAAKPEDWDDEEDGEWEPPKVPNPKCEEGPGCGEWKRPMKKNPAFKGKWKAPMIENPAYKGKWTARDIPNPEFFELDHPNLEPISAVGIEIWTMTNEVIFDNILITDSVEEAAEYRKKFWKPKFEKEQELAQEKAKKEAEERKKNEPKLTWRDHVFGKLHELADIPPLKPYSPHLHRLITEHEDKEYLVYGVLAAVVLVPLVLLISCCIPRGRSSKTSKVSYETAKKKDISSPDDTANGGEEKEAEGKGKEEEKSDKKEEVKEEEKSAESKASETEEKVRRRTRRDS